MPTISEHRRWQQEDQEQKFKVQEFKVTLDYAVGPTRLQETLSRNKVKRGVHDSCPPLCIEPVELSLAYLDHLAPRSSPCCSRPGLTSLIICPLLPGLSCQRVLEVGVAGVKCARRCSGATPEIWFWCPVLGVPPKVLFLFQNHDRGT